MRCIVFAYINKTFLSAVPFAHIYKKFLLLQENFMRQNSRRTQRKYQSVFQNSIYKVRTKGQIVNPKKTFHKQLIQ